MHQWDLQVNISETILDEFRCFLCNKHLSCGPIRVLPNGSCICGRCEPLDSEKPAYKVLQLESVLSKALFPCPNEEIGCKENVPFNQMREHESICSFSSFSCPLFYQGCAWKGSSFDIFLHFMKEHQNFVTYIL